MPDLSTITLAQPSSLEYVESFATSGTSPDDMARAGYPPWEGNQQHAGVLGNGCQDKRAYPKTDSYVGHLDNG